jgi:hypothetical protein
MKTVFYCQDLFNVLTADVDITPSPNGTLCFAEVDINERREVMGLNHLLSFSSPAGNPSFLTPQHLVTALSVFKSPRYNIIRGWG